MPEKRRRARGGASGLSLDAGGTLALAVFLLIAIGTLNVYSSTQYMSLRLDGSTTYYLLSHLRGVAIGLFGGWLAYRIDYRSAREGGLLGLRSALVLTFVLLVTVLLVGVTINGARRWIYFGVFNFQPSEMAKVFAVMWAASELAYLRDANRPVTLIRSLHAWLGNFFNKRAVSGERVTLREWRPLAVPLVFAGLVFVQPDFGTSLLVLLGPLLLYFIAGLPWREIIITLVVALIGGAAAVAAAPYRLARLIAWYDPFQYAQDLGYQAVQSIIAVGSGGFFGQGFGRGLSKFAYLPEQYTDFAYAVWAQETGFFFSLFVLLLITVIWFCGLRIAQTAEDRYGRYLCYGLTLLLVAQGVYNIAMTMGVMPVTGVPLPFISYGGSALLFNSVAVGTVLNVDRVTKEKRRIRRRQELAAQRHY